ncbi:putative Ubiquitin-like domain-containing protein [Dioscorea sansibarensis]
MKTGEGKRRATKIAVKERDGYLFDMWAEPDDLVADVKKNIERKCGQTLYPAEIQQLRYEGKVLKDDTTLYTCLLFFFCVCFFGTYIYIGNIYIAVLV